MAKEVKAPETQAYILRPNHEHNGFDENGERTVFVGGDEVQLTERQYLAFKDKFDSREELRARARVANGGKVSREEALAALGITEEEYSKVAPVVETEKKPDPKPGTGTAEQAPKDVTPAPIGSTSDQVNAAPGQIKK